MYIGGCSIANFAGVEVKITQDTGSVTVSNLDKVLVQKFNQWKKPVFVVGLTVTANSAEKKFGGYGAHSFAAGVHTHTYANLKITTVSETSLTFTLS